MYKFSVGDDFAVAAKNKTTCLLQVTISPLQKLIFADISILGQFS
jgi:hypothetical protein